MSDLLEIQEKLQDTKALIARLEREIANGSLLPSLRLNLEALYKRREKLEAERVEAAGANGVDVCRRGPNATPEQV